MSAQSEAQLQILLLLGAVALVGVGVLATIALLIVDRRRGAARTAGATALVIGVYAAALLLTGAARDDRVLASGEAKVFCEIDCHLAYRVVRARAAASPDGRLLVTVRTHFDERTVAPWRGPAPLRPSPRRARLVDDDGRAWNVAAVSGAPLDTPLRPGESYETTLAFDLPADVHAPRLELTEAAAVTRVIVGHENSPMHGKVLLPLEWGIASGAAR